MKLDIKSFALAVGIVAAVWGFVTHIIAVATGAGLEFIDLVLNFHPGATLSYVGAIVHGAWMFVYGFASGGLFAWLYNKFTKEQPTV